MTSHPIAVDEEEGNIRRHRRFLRSPTTLAVVEDKLPRRGYHEGALTRSQADVDEAVEMDNRQGKYRAKKIVAFMVVAIVVTAIVDLSCHDNIRNWLERSFDWIEENPEAGEQELNLQHCCCTNTSFCC